MSQLKTNGKIKENAEAYLKAATEHRGFTGSALISIDGSIAVLSAHGMANHAQKAPNKPDTVFRIGSITKQFTAAAIMKLELDGKLKTTDKLNKFLKDPVKAWEPITIHHLLSHTSGLYSLTADPIYGRVKNADHGPVKTLQWAKDKPLVFEPGAKQEYSNSGYIALGMIIERVTGKSYFDYLGATFFKPNGLSRTGHEKSFQRWMAVGYESIQPKVVVADPINMIVPHAAGAISSTVGDLNRWVQALWSGKALPKSAIDKMWTNAGGPMGYGWVIDKPHGHRRVWHNGGIDGFVSCLLTFPDEKTVVAAISNSEEGDADRTAYDLSQIAFGRPFEMPKAVLDLKLAEDDLKPFVGKYKIMGDTIIEISLKNGSLYAQVTGQPPFRLQAQDNRTFEVSKVGARLIFSDPADGKSETLTIVQGGVSTPCQRQE
ncbi:MAG: serine hydrolase [Armatimonadetes bacterium]|nr:serine hydrolase [Armatimonadota bacterium]